MALKEVTGATDDELEEIRQKYRSTPQHLDHEIPFEVAYCLSEINNQPDSYKGAARFCKKRVIKRDEDDYEGDSTDEAAFAACCKTHGGDLAKHGKEENLAEPKTAAIKHGAEAEDKHLIMDFTDDEQELYNSIMEDWPEIYEWPDQSADPARYRILRRVAVNEVRALREEEYLDDREVYAEPVFDEQGVEVGYKDTENPLAREYRLLMSEVTDQMKELGLTPKERQKMNKLSSEESKNDAITEIASDALDDSEGEYDPEQFTEDNG